MMMSSSARLVSAVINRTSLLTRPVCCRSHAASCGTWPSLTNWCIVLSAAVGVHNTPTSSQFDVICCMLDCERRRPIVSVQKGFSVWLWNWIDGSATCMSAVSIWDVQYIWTVFYTAAVVTYSSPVCSHLHSKLRAINRKNLPVYKQA